MDYDFFPVGSSTTNMSRKTVVEESQFARRIAVREWISVGNTGSGKMLFWLSGDHLGSTSRAVSADGLRAVGEKR